MSEYVYIGHDNDIRLLLKQNDVASDLSSVTKIEFIVGSSTVTSTNQANDPIRWAQGGYVTGEVRMELGAQSLKAGHYSTAPLVVYDASNTNGIVWGTIDTTVYGRRGGGPVI